MQKLTFKKSFPVSAPASEVWKALTTPSMIKEYLFGTNTVTDWKQGSPIEYTGEWQGKKYTDKGTIVEIIPEKVLHTTYFSSMSGKEDKPENYANVIYRVEPEGNTSMLTISQDNIDTEDQLKHMEQNWSMVAGGIKKLLEK